jgi:hypothetical protein
MVTEYTLNDDTVIKVYQEVGQFTIITKGKKPRPNTQKESLGIVRTPPENINCLDVASVPMVGHYLIIFDSGTPITIGQIKKIEKKKTEQ